MKEIRLTHPLDEAELQTSYPRGTRGMQNEEISAWLRILERALRESFGVVSTSKSTDAAVKDAMLVAWPSFRMQVMQIASETTSAEEYTVRYATANDRMVFPDFVSTLLRPYSDDSYGTVGPSTTRLVRDDC